MTNNQGKRYYNKYTFKKTGQTTVIENKYY